MVNETLEILKLLIERREEPLSIRKISKIRKINYKSAYIAVHKLEEKQIVQLQRIGNTLACSITSFFDDAVFHAEYSRREELFKNKDFKIIHDRLASLPFPFIALLFGSYAKGTPRKHSDIDLLAIGGDQKEIKASISLLPDRIHLTLITYEDFITMAKSREFSVVSEAIKRNIILIGIEEYYRLLHNAV